MPNLQELELHEYTVGGEDIRDFIDALERSGCAKKIAYLRFFSRGFGFEAMCAMADLLGRDSSPALKKLWINGCPAISDEGVVALAEALLISLRGLSLMNVGMGDNGLLALASLIYQGRFKQWKHLYFLQILP